MLDQLLGGDKSALISSIASQLGIGKEQADGFIAKALASVQQAFASGKVDFDKLMKGDLSGLTSSMDLQSLSQFVGGDVKKAQGGVASVLESINKQLSAQGFDAESMSKLIGGGGGGIGQTLSGLAGKLFGKQ